jgi:2,4-dienoyl-CoA reductase-like NADH-dependent reductase (Old Yellow Enzyme family)
MSRIEGDFVKAVEVARSCSFDAVELHCGHGYLLSQFLSRATNPAAKQASDRLEFPLRVVRAVVAAAHNFHPYIAVLVKFNCSEKHEQDLTFDDVRLYARSFYDAGVDLLVPSGGHVMTNGLHMLRGGRPVAAMAAAQKNPVKRAVSGLRCLRNTSVMYLQVMSMFGRALIAEEIFRPAFFRERSIALALSCGIPMSSMCCVGGVQELAVAEACVQVDGFGAVQMGRALLADADWCVKNELAAGEASGDIHMCDKANQCIVGPTMALQPLRCAKLKHAQW